MKKILLFLSFLLLTSCWEVEEQIVEEKQDFIVETQSYSGFTNQTYLDKSWKIDSSQNISLTAQATGRVSNISVEQWNPVVKWQVLATLEDSISNYSLSLQQANNALDRAKISYDSNKINLDKSVFDAEQNVDKLTKNLEALKLENKETINQAQSDLENTNIEDIDSKGALDVQKLQNSIEKSKLDYENKLITDNETLEWYYSSVKKEYNSMSIFLGDIVEFSDTLYGVTELNKDENEDIDQFLWAKNVWQKNEAKILLKEIIAYNNDIFSQIDVEWINSQDKLLDTLEKINSAYNKSKNLLSEVEKTLNFSISSVNSLSNLDISNYNASVNGYQATLQWNYSGFLAFDNNVKSFLRTYINNQKSTLQSIELMEKDLEILKKSYWVNQQQAETNLNKLIINTAENISNLEIQLESAKNSLENAKKSRDVTLRSLQNAINEANIWYQTSLKEYNKLTITSPINGIVSSVDIDLGQELSTGTNVFSLVNNSENQVDISFTKDELTYIDIQKPVFVQYDGESYTWSIQAVSQTADVNLKYPATITIDENVNLIWNIVNVDIPVKVKNPLFPINIVKVLDAWKWEINILTQENKIKSKFVATWNIYGKFIEVLDEIPQDTKIITNFVDNYSPEKFNLKIKTTYE